ncbi:hypothetical protein L226DRAFT_609453 [Lentinus tigrinus ALCF2SS1-7]|uniref:RING-type domain-containing protein n=1 Tax=Lentinus tigrinus ALCF2SS1-6 TaxID=1328759 RepID=A0A5C2ST71_9APHY|nr:hypothetical protein L227DRAFT_597751 [Lentinus tigrinus ALCF2SS1-6]RPD80595.1 hypothetical protein L226DRAFT_609453 [Lentinus tigrinus ALCF2SS1-7]
MAKSFARCNQCKLVFKSASDCGQHGASSGHAHRPSYYCTVCLMAFNKLNQRNEHEKGTGHVQTPPRPGTYAVRPANAAATVATNPVGTHPGPSTAATATPVSKGAGLATVNASSPSQPPQPSGASAASHLPADTNDEVPESRCAKCNVGFQSAEELQAHYDVSPLHPTCRDCGLGFASIGPWATHKARCPPPGSTAMNSGVTREKGTSGLSSSVKEIRRDVATPSPSESSLSTSGVQDASHSVQLKDSATTGGSGTTMTVKPSNVSSIMPATATVPDTPKLQRAASPSQSSAVSMSFTASSNTPPSSHVTAQSRSLDEQTDKVYRVLQGEQLAPDAPKKAIQPYSRHAEEDEEETRAATTQTGITKRFPLDIDSASLDNRRTTRSVDANWQHPNTVQSPRPSTTKVSNAPRVSFHCRSCLRDPCVQPVTTICGHIFCHRCIVQELSTKMCCPVCEKIFFIRLHVKVD